MITQQQSEIAKMIEQAMLKDGAKCSMQKGLFNTILNNFLLKRDGNGPLDYGDYKDTFEKIYKPFNTIDGFTTYYVESDENYERVIVYFHGGAYVFGAGKEQYAYAAECAKGLNARVYLPDYPLAPKYSCKDAYDFLNKLYPEILKAEEGKDIIFIGDSAGGGLGFAYSEYLFENSMPGIPSARVFYSPWVDCSCENKEQWALREVDPLLDLYGMSVCGRMWIGDDLPNDPKINVIFGDMKSNIKTLLFSGTKEILYPDVKKTYDKLLANGCEVEFVLGEGLFHCYPIFVPDMGAEAMQIVKNFLN